MFTTFKRICCSGWLSFYRNSGISIATIFIMVMTISLVTSLFIFRDVTRFFISTLQEKVDISVYFRETTQEEDVLRVKEEISQIPEVKNVEYISQPEALDRFVQKYKDDPVIMGSLVEVGNPFRASLNVQAWQASQYEAVANFLETSSNKDLIEKVDYHQRKAVIERISSLTAGMSKAGIVLSLMLGLLAVLVTFHAIKLAIYSSKDEISMMRLVGASNWFIRGPFWIQGALSGFFAVVATILIFTVTLFFLAPKLEILFSGLNVFKYFMGSFWFLFLIQIFTGVGLGIISSSIAIRKYLKV